MRIKLDGLSEWECPGGLYCQFIAERGPGSRFGRIIRDLMLAGFCLLLACSSAMGQSPTTMIDVDSSAQIAIEDEAPVLPDDFARNDPPRVSANWLPSSPAEQSPSVPAKIVHRERSRSELSQWVQENYRPSTSLSTDVSPRSNVWNHLVQDHGFLSHQVNGLPQWQALALHDAAHSGKIGPFEESYSSSADGKDSGITLFTADGDWCEPCRVQAGILRNTPVSFTFKTVKGPSQGESPSGRYPCWQGADGTLFNGAMYAADLEKWAKEHGRKESPQAKPKETAEGYSGSLKPIASVQIESGKASAVLAALADHVSRSSGPESLRVSGRSWLPEIDVDLDDPFLKVLDGLLSAEGFELGGAKISWPSGKRSISFDPPIDASYRKVLEVSTQVKSVEVNNREVILRLNGRLIPDLRVILK